MEVNKMIKKAVVVAIVAVFAWAVFYHWERIKAYTFHCIPQITQSIQDSGFVDDIRREVLTSGPLRSAENAVNGHLTASGVLEWTNENRASQGLPALSENTLLSAAAAKKLQDMFKNQYFEHVSPSGIGPADLADEAGYEYVAVGENLALGNFKDDERLVTAWMNSPGHRANIMGGKYTEIGIAVGKGKFEGKTIWLAVQEFGKPMAACPALDKSLKANIDSYKDELVSLERQINALKSELENSRPQTKEQYEYHNEKVGEYNDLVKLYNNKIDILKQATSDYNAQVKRFNECVET